MNFAVQTLTRARGCLQNIGRLVATISKTKKLFKGLDDFVNTHSGHRANTSAFLNTLHGV